VQVADNIIRQPTILAACALVLAMALGVLLALIVAEVRKGRGARPAGAATHRRRPQIQTHSTEEIERRQSVVKQLIELYSGVHSVEALSNFLNGELERRHERWRVRIPSDGPGEFYDLDP
jgi:hypothetical protein